MKRVLTIILLISISGLLGYFTFRSMSLSSRRDLISTAPASTDAAFSKRLLSKDDRRNKSAPLGLSLSHTDTTTDPLAKSTVQQTLNEPGRGLWTTRVRLSDDEVLQLIGKYRTLAKPSQKKGIVWQLGLSRNHLAAEFLTTEPFKEYQGTNFNRLEHATFVLVFDALGCLASDEPIALDFLKRHTDPDSWGSTLPYQLENEPDVVVRYFITGFAYQGIAVSGSPGSEEFIYQKAVRMSEQDRFGMGHLVIQSIFHVEMLKREGPAFIENIVANKENAAGTYILWRGKSEQGKAWGDWFKKGTPPPEPATQ